MELFRGDSFIKKIISDEYEFKTGDKLHIVVLRTAYSKDYLHEQRIEVKTEKFN